MYCPPVSFFFFFSLRFQKDHNLRLTPSHSVCRHFACFWHWLGKFNEKHSGCLLNCSCLAWFWFWQPDCVLNCFFTPCFLWPGVCVCRHCQCSGHWLGQPRQGVDNQTNHRVSTQTLPPGGRLQPDRRLQSPGWRFLVRQGQGPLWRGDEGWR